MANPATIITDHLDTWSLAIKKKSSAGRGSGTKQEFYGIKKLRELILELAIRGLVVPQDDSDEPAAKLINKIAIEKAKLIKDGKIKKGKKIPDSEEELPFDIPNSWTWTQLVEISEIGPRNTLPDDLNVGFVPMPLISTSYDGTHDQEIKTWSEIKKGYTHFANGDIAIAKITPCFENSKAAIFGNLENGHGAGTTELHVARLIGEFVNSRFLLLYLKAPMFLEKGKPKMTGSAGQKRIPAKYFAGNPLPLPPLAEQHRIVAKVDELMALCDQLEQQQEDSVRTHSTLVQTLLGALTATSERGQFAQAWQRITSHFDILFITESSIDQLKQTILQLAVMGKLVEQDLNDETTATLLKKIAAEKKQLIKEKKIRKQKPLPPVVEGEKPFEVPEGWAVARFYEICQEVSTGPFGSMIHKNDYIVGGVPLINPSHMINGKIIAEEKVSVNSEKASELNSYAIHEGDIVMARRGEMGRCAIVTKDEDGWLCGTGSFVLRFNSDISINYMLILFKSEKVVSYLRGESVGMTMTNLNHGILNKMPVILPPAAEQKQIVDKVGRLMTLCDLLKARLQTAQATQLHLADSLVEAAIR